MITRLTLENWKAYKSLDLTFADGATFVIARNGIGKTSLIEGAMWALFGDVSSIDPAACLRSGSQGASATVELVVDTENVRISRTYSARDRKSEAAVTVAGDTTVGGPAVERYLSKLLGAEPSILARMSFLREGEAVTSNVSETMDLRAHLAHVFGVDALAQLSSHEDERRRGVSRDARETRKTQRLADSSRAQLTARLEQLETDLVAIRTEHAASRRSLTNAEQAVAMVTSWREFDLAMERRAIALQDVLNRLAQYLRGDELMEADVNPRLATERSDAQKRLEELNRERGATDAERTLLANLASSLDEATQTCPVCLRPISPEERRHAEMSHADRMRQLEFRGEELRDLSQATRDRLVELDQWAEEFRRATVSPLTPSGPRPDSPDDVALTRAREELSAATQSLEQVAARLAQAEAELSACQDELRGDAAADTTSKELFRRYREEALSELVSLTLRRSTDQIVARRIDPLATEIQNRWKLLWPTRAPLKLLPNGTLVATRSEHEIPYGQFSGGEKVISTIILRLLALSMTTTTPFLWLDEPLEHLDPRNRRLVASLLVKASQGDQTKQIIATTYEEAVARRLDETEAARLVYVEAEPEA
jgi:DNA repair exonuclease SbcCD ATPase subunit